MILLEQNPEPLHRESCLGPVPIEDDVMSGKAEEAGTLWVWVWPRLLNWPNDITWLFSPVVGTKRPGDLWGVDSAGNLLMIESKRSVRTEAQDPFEDFVGYEVPSVDQILEHWRSSLRNERRFIQEHILALREDRLALGRYPGLVPYSKQRFEIKRWRHLYCERLAPLIAGKDYEERIESNLGRYVDAGHPTPHYFALFTLFEGGRAALSQQGVVNYLELVQKVGAENHVHMYSVQRFPASCWFPAACEIRSYRLHLARS